MEDLKSLIKLISKQKIKQIEIISEGSNISKKSTELYEGIRNGKFTTDKEAAQILYGEEENYPSYIKLKYRLKKRLLNTLFFIDVQEYSKTPIEKASVRAYKNWSASKILMVKGLMSQSYNISETLLKTTLKYDLVDLSLIIVRDLKKKYGILQYNRYKYNKYKELFEELKHTFDKLSIAEDYYTDLARIILHSKSYTYDESLKSLESRFNNSLKDAREIDSYMLRYYIYNSEYFINLIKKDNNKLLQICIESLQYFKKKKGFGKLAVFSFTQKKGIIHLLLKDYNKALGEFKKCLALKPIPGSTSWHFIHGYLFSTHLLKKDYQTAYEIVSIILNHKTYKHFTETHEQTWHLKEAFIQFLIKSGKINPQESQAKPLRTFKLSRFLNEIPEISKDKRGYNITVNILQMLFLIVDEKYDQVLDKLSSLKQYNFRYLKRPEYSRSSNFIKMLLKVPECDYKRELVIEKSKRYYDELISNPQDFSDQSLNIEILPYEQLWEVLLDVLD